MLVLLIVLVIESPNDEHEHEHEQECKRMGGRVVYCARLESVFAARQPGFESLPIRHLLAWLKLR